MLTCNLECKYVLLDECGGIHNIPRGTLVSPGYPHEYPNNLYCEWIISVPHGRIVLEIAVMNLEKHPHCYYDSVKVS